MMAKDSANIVGRVVLGHGPGQAVSVYGLSREHFGIPAVCVRGDLESLSIFDPEKATALAMLLLAAAKAATGNEKMTEAEKNRL